MNARKKILGATLLVLAAVGFAVSQWCLKNVYSFKNYKDTDMTTLVENDSTEINSNDEKDLDSVFHSRICSDYGVAWKSYDLKKKKNKIVLFDSYSGDLLIYYFNKSQKISKLGVAPADQAFSWDFSNNKLSGMYGWIEKDTTFYWTINERKQQLIDENGMVFEKIKIPVNKRE
jgi:hypothetical protein